MSANNNSNKAHLKDFSKPRSRLQKINTQANWAAYFQLHTFYANGLSEVKTSAKTRNLIERYNETVKSLRASILSDAEKNKEYIIRETKKDID